MVLFHQVTCDKDKAPILAMKRMNKTAKRSLFGLLKKLFKFIKFFEGLIPKFMWLIFDEFELEVTNVLMFEDVGNLCSTVDDISKLITD